MYIEYWGMDTLDYKIGMLIKQQMYQHAGKRLVSLYPADKPRLDAILREKLLRLDPTDSAAAPSVPTADPAAPAPCTRAAGIGGALRSETAAPPRPACCPHPERTP